jgi:hypothetical protein
MPLEQAFASCQRMKLDASKNYVCCSSGGHCCSSARG